MSGWQQLLATYHTAHARQVGIHLGRIAAGQERDRAKLEEALALLRELQSSKPAPSKLGMVKEFGSMLLKALMPYLTPYVGAAVMGLGALGVGAFKAITRGWPL